MNIHIMDSQLKRVDKDDLEVGRSYYEDALPDFEGLEFERYRIGPFVHGVETLVLQGGNDECYVFVLQNSGHSNGALYKLVYAY